MKSVKLERNMRMYVGKNRGLHLSDIARLEGVTLTRAYQIISATEYQLASGNPMYWEEYKKQKGDYAKI